MSIRLMELHDWLFALAMGAFFLTFAKPFGWGLADQMDGPKTPEQRARSARWNTLVWRIFGGALVTYAGWRLLGL
jgi:hypothetical protein